MLVMIHTVSSLDCTVSNLKNYTDYIGNCNLAERMIFNVNWTSNIIPQNLIDQTLNINSIEVKNQPLDNIREKGFCQWPNLVAIYAESNNITSLPANLLFSCSKLQTLSLSGNNIDTIDVNAFKNLSSLSLLDLSNNNIEVFNGIVCEPLSSLITLRLNNNKLKYLDADTLINLFNLESLDLSHNSIIDIGPGSFLQMNNLITLNMSFNENLTDINLNEMPELEMLNIENCQFTELCITPNLVTIVANFNNISAISIDEPTFLLDEVYLKNNSLQDIEWTALASNLTFLDASNNNISDVNFLLFINPEAQYIFSGNPVVDLTWKIEQYQAKEINRLKNNLDLYEATFLAKNHNLSLRVTDKIAHLYRELYDFRVMTYCTIVAFTLFVIVQIGLYVYKNRMRCNSVFPNLITQTNNGGAFQQTNDFNEYYPNLLENVF